MSTGYGRKTLDLHIEKFVRLREMLLLETRAIRELSSKEPFAEPLRLLMTVPGIGITTGITLLMEIDDISKFKNADQLASYIGLIPMYHSDGKKEGVGDITVRKHAMLRCCLSEAAWKVVSKDSAMTMAYEEYCERMSGNKAIVKIVSRLVYRVFFVLKRKQQYVACIV